MNAIKLNLMLFVIVTIFSCYKTEGDYYKLLGIEKDASVKDIRKAFKTLAIQLHPDKNMDDPNADENFIRVVKAYETLKSPEQRKRYDLYGEVDDTKSTYKSYTYYKDVFGLYDDDPLIITLSRHDYEVNVVDDIQAWFVNFYSPQCNHCHDLAPTWRHLAQELDGVVKIAAVNCEEDWALCRQLNIDSYPTLLYYEKEVHLLDGEYYRGDRDLESLQDFILSMLKVNIDNLSLDRWRHENLSESDWVLFPCACNNQCPEETTKLKVSATLESILSIGEISDEELCQIISETTINAPIVFWQSGVAHLIDGSDTKELVNKILEYFPNPTQISNDKFKDIRDKLREGHENPWLLCFLVGSVNDLNLQIKRLSISVPNINLGLVHCAQYSSLCHSLHVSRYPAWGILKEGGAFELFHGRDIFYEILAFARDAAKSVNFHALSPADFQNIIDDGKPWFIDWFAPWCPPCRNLLPELRRASMHFTTDQIQFGTIDCTMYKQLCSQQGISSYPTTVIYNNSKTIHFHGTPNEDSIVEFVTDALAAAVISLDGNSFVQLLRKPENELWIVDFFAPWCGPCQRLAPEWRSLAKELAAFPLVKVADVDCVANNDLCSAQNVRSYPTIRMYPLDSKGLNTVVMYNGHRDLVSMKRWVLGFLPTLVDSVTAKEFEKQVLQKRFFLPYLVDFYASWCRHCIDFEPSFSVVAQKLQGRVRCIKLDCDKEREFCRQLRIASYPTVMLYTSPNQRFQIDSQVPKEIVDNVRNIIKQHVTAHDEL